MKHMRTNTSLQETMKRLGVSCLVEYGSTARGETTKGKDLDLGVLFAEDPTPGDEQKILDALTELFPTVLLDIAVLNHASPLLNFHVARDGRVLFEARMENFLRFKIKALRQYWDTAKFRRMREAFVLK